MRVPVGGRPFGPATLAALSSLLLVIAWIAGLIAWHSVAAAGKAYQWRVGAAVVKITPTEPVSMSGFAWRRKPLASVKTDLYAKVLAFEDADSHRAVLITADLVSIGGRIAQRVCKRVTSAAGLERRQILLNVSHTHAGLFFNSPESKAIPCEVNSCPPPIDILGRHPANSRIPASPMAT